MAFYFYPLIIYLLVAFYFDAKTQRLPNWLTISGALFGLTIHVVWNGIEGLIFSFLGLVVGFFIMFVLCMIKAVGFGDVKLFGAIGAFVGTEFILYGTMYSVIYAGIIGLFLIVFKKEFLTRTVGMVTLLITVRNSENKKEALDDYKKKQAMTFPFMYAVIPGMITTYYYVIL